MVMPSAPTTDVTGNSLATTAQVIHDFKNDLAMIKSTQHSNTEKVCLISQAHHEQRCNAVPCSRGGR